MGELRIVPLAGIPEISPGDDLGALLGDAVERAGGLQAGDVLVVAQKVVSKSEGRLEETDDVVGVVLREARAVRRRRGDLVIAETEHGFVCASAGVDRSNSPGDGWVVLLPRDPDASAWRVRAALGQRFGAAPAVIVSDSFGRAWRQGTATSSRPPRSPSRTSSRQRPSSSWGRRPACPLRSFAAMRHRPARARRASSSCLRSAICSRDPSGSSNPAR